MFAIALGDKDFIFLECLCFCLFSGLWVSLNIPLQRDSASCRTAGFCSPVDVEEVMVVNHVWRRERRIL